MPINDKKNILAKIVTFPVLILELGCGSHKRNPNALGVDILDYPDVDLVGDVYEVLAAFPSHSVDKVYSYHFIEHVPDVSRLLGELARVIKPYGKVEFVAPHFSNPYFYSDPTHQSFFGLYTFSYYSSVSPFSRCVPTYGYIADFRLAQVNLIFKSPRPFFVRYAFKKIIGKLFNSCTYMQELYEENFCYIFPCYEVHYVLERHTLEA
jgi:ubiquinone/menaquinone biosynthesis C-methylase UbiE